MISPENVPHLPGDAAPQRVQAPTGWLMLTGVMVLAAAAAWGWWW